MHHLRSVVGSPLLFEKSSQMLSEAMPANYRNSSRNMTDNAGSRGMEAFGSGQRFGSTRYLTIRQDRKSAFAVSALLGLPKHEIGSRPVTVGTNGYAKEGLVLGAMI